ncbi:hypothetical protein [uncultured Thiohalocapsa sp.]|uniref:hypothetical protein n=1 Tax=uncultured Thiohalocapsa sp. TaxID=768990 RepID=UPI0025ED2300|nr:hypothetical protein [uncultured Thiohalocapsa sp.]
MDGIHFQGYRTLTNETFEDALSGWDGEAGIRLPVDAMETRVYAGGYLLDGDLTGSVGGWKARLEVRPLKSLAIDVGYRDDPWFGGRVGVTLRYAFGQKPERGVRSLDERMIEPTRRDLDIIVSPPDLTPPQSVVLHTNTIHIDSRRGLVGGDGSWERPYPGIDACREGRCVGGGGALVRLWQGNSSGEPYALTSPWRLPEGLDIWGEGWRIEPRPTRSPSYRDWLARGFPDASRAPRIATWRGPGAGDLGRGVASSSSSADHAGGTQSQANPSDTAGIVLGDGGAVRGVELDVRGLTDELGTPAPAVLADGAADFVVQGNVLITDAVGVAVRARAAAIAAPASNGDGPAAAPELAGPSVSLPDGSPVQGRILDNLVLGSGVAGAQEAAAVEVENVATGGVERRQAIVYGSSAAPVSAGSRSASQGQLRGVRAVNRATGQGSRAVQTVYVVGPGQSLPDGVVVTNRAEAGGTAEQILIAEGPLDTAGLRLDNSAVGGASVAVQLADLRSVRITEPTDHALGDAGISIENRAVDGGVARQGAAFVDAELALGASGLALRNLSAGAAGSAVQQLELAGSGRIGRVDLLNEARGTSRATQQADIRGLAFGTADVPGQWVGIVNGAFDGATAEQAVRLVDAELRLQGGGGLFIGSGAYGQASAQQWVRLTGSGRVGWLSHFNQSAHGASSTQQVHAAGFSVAASDPDGGIEAVNGAFLEATAEQGLMLDLDGIDLAEAGLLQRSQAESGAAAAQHLSLMAAAPARLATVAVENRSDAGEDPVGGDTHPTSSLQTGTLSLTGGMQIDDLAVGSQAGPATLARQDLDLRGTGGGLLGGLRLSNAAHEGAESTQRVRGTALPLAAAHGNGRLGGVNQAGAAGVAVQDVALGVVAAAVPGGRALLLDNEAAADGAADQTFVLRRDESADSPGSIGAVSIANAAGAGAGARQRLTLLGLAVASGSVPGLSDSEPAASGIAASNQSDAGEAWQALTVESDGRQVSGARLALHNHAVGSDAVAGQALLLAGGEGVIGGLDIDNRGSSQAIAGQTARLVGPELVLDGDSAWVGNEAGGGTATQSLLAELPALSLGATQPLAIANAAQDGGEAAQDVRLVLSGPVLGTDAGSGTALALRNSAQDVGTATQELDLAADALALSGRAFEIGNSASGGGFAGQIAVLGVTGDGPGRLGALSIDNEAAGTAAMGDGAAASSRADQVVSADGAMLDDALSLAAEAVAGAQGRQAAELGLGLADASVRASSTAEAGAGSDQGLALRARPGSRASDLGIEADASDGGSLRQAVQVRDLAVSARAPQRQGAPVRLAASASAGAVEQLLDLTDMAIVGADHGLAIRALTAAGMDTDIAQQVTLRGARVVGGDVGILIDPGVPVQGRVAQHLLLWSTAADGRFEPARIASLDDLAGLTQTLTIDGVRQTVHRELLLPDGSVVLIDDDGNAAVGVIQGDNGGGGGYFGGAVIDSTIGVIGGDLRELNTRSPNFGDLLGSTVGTLVHDLDLPDAAALSPGAIAYLRDLSARRGNPLTDDDLVETSFTLDLSP